jgi:hypothetical protein
MTNALSEMSEVTIELDEEELAELEDRAFKDHRGNTEAAIRTVLDEWLKEQSD